MPPQEKRLGAENMYIPPELVEKVLLKLPVKSLSRFSTVSKSWNSTIHSRDFDKRYRGREMIVLIPKSVPDNALVYPLSSIHSGNPTADLPLPVPISRAIVVSCGELWCVELEDGSVCLYNPSMRTCRKLPACPTPVSTWFIYGVGYDSATDDYKVLRLNINTRWAIDSELYSQRSDSWRNLGDSIESIKACIRGDNVAFLALLQCSDSECVFVNGLLHWIVVYDDWISCASGLVIVSFDLSTEKYGKVAMPEPRDGRADLGVLRGKLSVYSYNIYQYRGVVWVHEGGLWSKEMVFNYSQIFPNIGTDYYNIRVRPLHSYNSNCNSKAFVATTKDRIANTFLNEDRSTFIAKIFLSEDDSGQVVTKDFCCGFIDCCFTYVESMVKQ